MYLVSMWQMIFTTNLRLTRGRKTDWKVVNNSGLREEEGFVIDMLSNSFTADGRILLSPSNRNNERCQEGQVLTRLLLRNRFYQTSFHFTLFKYNNVIFSWLDNRKVSLDCARHEVHIHQNESWFQLTWHICLTHGQYYVQPMFLLL